MRNHRCDSDRKTRLLLCLKLQKCALLHLCFSLHAHLPAPSGPFSSNDIFRRLYKHKNHEGTLFIVFFSSCIPIVKITLYGIITYFYLFSTINACCHVAVGAGFPEVLDGFLEMSKEEQTKRGINDSMIHTDFMIGSDDLDIVGIKKDGSEIQIFKNGTWAI